MHTIPPVALFILGQTDARHRDVIITRLLELRGGVMRILGGITIPPTTVTNSDTPHTIGNVARLLCDTSSGVITVTLPASGGVNGTEYSIKNIGSSGQDVTIAGNGANIDGVSSLTLIDQEAARIITDGTNWHIM